MAFAQSQILAAPRVTMNNVVISIKPNSFSMTEGRGEQTARVQSSGGGRVEMVYANNVESALSDIKFEMEPTEANIELALSWKDNLNMNTATVESATTGGSLTRSFDNVGLVNNYEVNMKADGVLSLEFKALRAV